MVKSLCAGSLILICQCSCCFSDRCYRPCLFFKNEAILADLSLLLFILSFPSFFGLFINSFALDAAWSIRSMHLAIAIFFSFVIFVSLSSGISLITVTWSLCVILWRGIYTFPHRINNSSLRCRKLLETAIGYRAHDLFILFPVLINRDDLCACRYNLLYEQKNSSFYPFSRNLVVRSDQECIFIQ